MLSKFLSVSETLFQNTETVLKNQEVSIQGLKTQIGQLSKLISERPRGSLPSNTKPNPREQLNTINVQDEEGFVEPEPEPRQETVVSKGQGEVDQNTNKSVNVEYKPRVPYPNATRKDRSDEKFGELTLRVGDETITLQVLNSGNPSGIEGDRLTHSPKTDSMNKLNTFPNQLKVGDRVLFATADPHIVATAPNEEIPLTVLNIFPFGTVEVSHPKFNTFKNELNTFPNQLKVGDRVLFDAADPHIVATTPNEEIPLTVLNIFPFGTVEVSHPKFGTFKLLRLSSRGKKAAVPASKKRKGASSSVGPTTEIKQVQLADMIRALLTTDPWELFFGIIEPIYLELTMELCSTFHLQTVMTNYDDPCTKFMEENDLDTLNRHIHRSPSRCWNVLVPGGATYNPSRSKTSALPPFLRYLHAILAHTITGR
ncbi:hypothetical protein GOBAR_AA21400 [Gossypium barbadense]|uniref:Uncharacterized protein n=1 Tax=Gossypium barbadense TaxID=3634 RepID=A0A2P5X7E4_GOSBA|nr:hypothetical protein GOBAR_AA21400 [Gossypium barbadense]